MKNISVIILAAGNSTRMGNINKQFIMLKDKAVIKHTIEKFAGLDDVIEIIIATKAENFAEIAKMCEDIKTTIIFAQGGDTRQKSVESALEKINKDTGFVAIHDGARPLVSRETILSLFADAVKYNAATLGVPVKDTVKIIDENGFIDNTPQRSKVYIAQTPQVFERNLYEKAMSKAVSEGKDYTDDCQLVESYGEKVFVSMGDYSNIKITTVEDVKIAQALLERESEE